MTEPFLLIAFNVFYCNAHCTFCYITDHPKRTHDIDFDSQDKLLAFTEDWLERQNREAPHFSLLIQGGEVTLNKPVGQHLIKWLKQYDKLKIDFTTNGVSVNADFMEVLLHPQVKPFISLNTYNAERYKKIMGINRFDTVVKLISYLDSKREGLTISTVLEPEDLKEDHIGRFLDFVYEKWPRQSVRVIPEGAWLQDESRDKLDKHSSMTYVQALKRIKKYFGKAALVATDARKLLYRLDINESQRKKIDRYIFEEHFSGNPETNLGKKEEEIDKVFCPFANGVHILDDGTVRPCCFISHDIGKISEGFDYEKMLKFKKTIQERYFDKGELAPFCIKACKFL
jgi:sulfatase maturation enzyme AslB (radical SAM superfamily)